MSSSDIEKPRLLVFSDDWGRHPSSCQYIIGKLLDEIDVTWVNTIGMRTPKFDVATLQRVAGKICEKIRYRSQKQTSRSFQPTRSPKICQPWMWPWFTRTHDRWLNQRLLTSALNKEMNGWPRPRIAVTTIPIVADLVGRLDIDRWVYYCVDDFSVWPGLDQKTILEMERELIQKVHTIIVVSDVLRDRIQASGRQCEIMTHGVDLDEWSIENVTPYVWPRGITAPVFLFWGVIDQRLDSDFVIALSEKIPQGTIVFVGPQQSPDPRLAKLSNVRMLPPVARQQLPCMAAAATCLIMPYRDSAVTRAMQPLKLKEYLATGKPIVVRELPSTLSWSDACDLADTPQLFVRNAINRINGITPLSQIESRKRLSEEAWAAKATRFLEKTVRSQLTVLVRTMTPE